MDDYFDILPDTHHERYFLCSSEHSSSGPTTPASPPSLLALDHALPMNSPSPLNLKKFLQDEGHFDSKLDNLTTSFLDFTDDSLEVPSSSEEYNTNEACYGLSSSIDEPPKKKKYKSKDSEKNRRDRINEKLQELKLLLPIAQSPSKRNITKEEILSEAIHHIHELHRRLPKSERLDSFYQTEVANQTSNNSGDFKKPKPAKRSRAFLVFIFVLAFAVGSSPFWNVSPNDLPLYKQDSRIPRHHSRILVTGDTSSNPSQFSSSQFYNELELWHQPKDSDEEGLSCSDLNPCQFPYQCIDDVCSMVTEGSTCMDSNDCGSWMKCVKGVCINPKFGGENCTTNAECYSRSCQGSVCSGKMKGKSCNPHSHNQCAAGFFCSLTKGVCTPQIQEGETGCMDVGEYSNYLSVCQGFSTCNSETNQCTRIRSLHEGSACGDNLNCQLSLECSDHQCVHQSSQSCVRSSTNVTCFQHKHNIHSCQSELEDWIECGTKNKCQLRPTFDWTENGSCMVSNCLQLQEELKLCLTIIQSEDENQTSDQDEESEW